VKSSYSLQVVSARAFLAEFVGTNLLVFAVVGSGIMAQSLTTDIGLQLLINAAATVAALYILINIIAPLSGAHFNPVVTMVSLLRGERRAIEASGYLVAQLLGAITGSLLAQLTFDLPFEISTKDRMGSHLLLGEVIATFGLLVIAFADWKQFRIRDRASLIALWIGGAYFFTSSTSFANPAVTLGRVFTDSFAGISAASVPPFIGAQILGALLAWLTLRAVRNSLSASSDLKEDGLN
jgi:glycerol uptake facilitator-like aquaporin